MPKATVPWLPDLHIYHPQGELCGHSMRMLQKAQLLVRERPRTEYELSSAMRVCLPLTHQIVALMCELGMLRSLHSGAVHGIPRHEFVDRTRPN